jgi:RNA polymerase sigma factor (sigma-70 family)
MASECGIRRPGPRRNLSAAPSGQTPDRVAPSATCDQRTFRCIYIPVTSSLFEFEVPQTLIARARAGELGAFEQIYRRFERPVYTLALRMLGEPESARDTLHDAMLKAFQRLDQYRSEAPFWAWLRQIALNETLMRLRKRRDVESDTDMDLIGDDAPAPWILADAINLERALGTLSDTARSVVWLYHVEGYSHPEIAAMMGKTISFSKSQLARGTSRLRAMLDPDEPDQAPRRPIADAGHNTYETDARDARFSIANTESVSCLMQTPLAG